MRVAVLSPYTEPLMGGITSYTRELARGYRAIGLEVMGLAAEGRTNDFFSVHGPSKILFIIVAVLKLLIWEPDIVHSHSHWHLLLPGVVVKFLRSETRLLFTFHTPPALTGRNLKQTLMVAMLRFCDRAIFVCREMKDSVRLPATIPQAVVYAAPEAFCAVNRSGPTDSSRDRVILFAGPMVWPGKVAGILMLLNSFAKIRPRFPDWRVVVAGNGPLRASVERVSSGLGLGGSVVFKGWVDDMASELAKASIYAQVSLQEGIPLSMINAMAMGTAVLATAVGGMPEVVEHSVTGYLVPPKEEELIAALTELIENKDLRRRLGDAGKQWAFGRSWEAVAVQHVQLAQDKGGSLVGHQRNSGPSSDSAAGRQYRTEPPIPTGATRERENSL